VLHGTGWRGLIELGDPRASKSTGRDSPPPVDEPSVGAGASGGRVAYGLLHDVAGRVASRAATSLNACRLSGSDMKASS
jgi:hypothetical protein